MPSTRKKLLLNTLSINLGCSCTRPKLSSIFHPKQKTKLPLYQKHHNFSHSSSYSTTTTSSSSSSSSGFRLVRPISVAVEKDSNDPYSDFRQSMLQMISENEIYSKDDLKELLNCFLQLNAPSLHGLIIRVFTEIWNGLFFSAKPGFSSPRFFTRPKII